MSKVDWSLAPDDATHFGQGEDCGYWAKSIGNQQYFINIARWDNGKWKEVSERYDEKFLTARPKQAWSGPEDGLPPVSTICEYRLEPSNQWHECEILYHIKHAHDEDPRAVVWNEHLGFDQVSGSNWRFRPIRTPAQIAADKRETAIREIMDIAQVDCRVTAARLVDAGFKREVV